MRLFVAGAVIVTFLMSFSSVSADSISVDKTSPSIKSSLASKSLLLDISTIGKDKLVAVGQYGHILLSSDGSNWNQANVPIQATLTNVFFLNDKLGWAVGHDATILHSQDGGVTWIIQQYLPELQKPLLDVFFKNEKQGIAVGAYGQFFRTNDGGLTWLNEFHQEFLHADDVDYINDLKAEDELAYLDEISFILPHFNRLVQDGETFYLLGETGLLAKSIDFGMNWQQSEHFYQGSLYSLKKTNTGALLVAGLRGHVFKNVNMDEQWQEATTNTTALLNDIVLSNDDRIFVLGNNGMLLISEDDGETFITQSQQDGKSLIAGVWFKQKLFAVSDVGIKILDLPKISRR